MVFSPYPDLLKTFNSQTLSQRLVIPSDYRQYYPTPLPQTAVIRKAEGIFWTVKWTIGQDETISFEDGWHKFVTDHRLIDGDILSFTYDGSRSFWVRIYRNGLILKAETPIKVQEISDDDDDDDSGDDEDVDYDPDKGEDSDEQMVISLSLESSSSEEDCINDIDTTSSKVNNARFEKGESSQKKRAASINDPDMYLDDPTNPCFIAASSCSKRLVIAAQVIKDYNLKFGGTVNLIDQFGELKAKVGEWNDRFVAFEWDKIYKRNGARRDDTIICEIIRQGGVVQSIKPHFIMK
ncbi:unnamed protein product [Microthlaspi erraticum]|uniref:TF-B3 domain-containing protein n=1 Tax=Microthlaspi erraticum TaxID=1685480 RepID=A0A6D2L6Q0_9BRAS|nr:unnamed protein product [Microthlaspi erraticum]